MSILIKNGTILTQNPSRDILRADVLIQEDKISEVSKGIKEKVEFVIDATNKIVLPGLINTHTHSPMTLFRGYGEGLPLEKWLEKKIWPAEKKINVTEIRSHLSKSGRCKQRAIKPNFEMKEDDVSLGTMVGAAEMICSGTTTFNDMYLVTEKMIDAIKEIGIRAVLSDAIFDALPGRSLKSELSRIKKSLELCNSKGGTLVRGALSCHSLYTCTGEGLTKVKELSKKEKVLFNIHISETRKELFDCLNTHKKRPFEYADSLGLLDSDSILAHAGWVSKREIVLAGKKGANISHCPISNLKLATGGIAPIIEFDQAGANVTLGTDGAASNNSLNMLETMKMTALLQKHKYWDANILSPQRVLDYATINGAKALGINAGSIQKGKLADIILLDARAFNLLPHHDIISNIIYSSNPSNLTEVIINGKILLKERKLLNFEESLLESFSKRARALTS